MFVFHTIWSVNTASKCERRWLLFYRAKGTAYSSIYVETALKCNHRYLLLFVDTSSMYTPLFFIVDIHTYMPIVSECTYHVHACTSELPPLPYRCNFFMVEVRDSYKKRPPVAKSKLSWLSLKRSTDAPELVRCRATKIYGKN